MIGSVMFAELQDEIANMSDHVNMRSGVFDSSDEGSMHHGYQGDNSIDV